MSWKNRGTTARRMNVTTTSLMPKSHCLLYFLNEKSYGVWPDHLIRSKSRFNFEAKYGKDWFECRIEKEGRLCHRTTKKIALKTVDIDRNG